MASVFLINGNGGGGFGLVGLILAAKGIFWGTI
jgi:hypothetical protein